MILLAEQPPRIAPWGDWLVSPDLFPWVQANVDVVELVIHTTATGPDARCEFFTCPTHGIEIKNAIEACAGLGLKVLLNVDCYFGNGRSQAQSAVGPGKYHNSLKEGGVDQAVRKVLSWARGLDNVIGLQLLNEQQVGIPAEWYAARAKHARARMPDDWVLVIGGEDPEDLRAAAPHADVIDPHILRSDWRARLARAETIADEHELKVWVSEMMPPKGLPRASRMAEYRRMCDYLKHRLIGPGVFVGNDQDYPRRADHKRRWNFNWVDDFLAIDNEGETPMGAIYRQYFGKETEPVEPPIPTPDPCEAKLQGVRGRCGRIADRLEEDVSDDSVQRTRLWRQVMREIPRLREIADG